MGIRGQVHRPCFNGKGSMLKICKNMKDAEKEVLSYGMNGGIKCLVLALFQ
jgi:hypothetical protein